MSIDRAVNVHVSHVQMKVWWVIYRCTVLGCVMLFMWDMAGGGGGTVLVFGCFGAQCSVAPARGQRFKERVSWVWGVQSHFLSPSPHSGGVKLLEAGQRGTDNPLSSPDGPLLSSDGRWTKPNSYRWTQSRWWQSRTVSAAPVAGWTSFIMGKTLWFCLDLTTKLKKKIANIIYEHLNVDFHNI